MKMKPRDLWQLIASFMEQDFSGGAQPRRCAAHEESHLELHKIVILSEVAATRSEAAAQSKDPYLSEITS